MANAKPIASLSSKGWITSITEKLDLMMAHFHASDANQDFLHAGSIANLAMLIKESGNDIPRFKHGLRTVLEQYLGHIFEMVVVDVNDDLEQQQSNRVHVSYAVMVTEAGQRYDLSYQLSLIDGKFEKITKLNNTGRIN